MSSQQTFNQFLQENCVMKFIILILTTMRLGKPVSGAMLLYMLTHQNHLLVQLNGMKLMLKQTLDYIREHILRERKNQEQQVE